MEVETKSVDALMAIINAYLPYLILLGSGFFFKDLVSNTISGLWFYFSRAYDVDDVVIIDGEVAAIRDVGFRYTSFWMYETRTKAYISNNKVAGMIIRKYESDVIVSEVLRGISARHKKDNAIEA